MSTEQSASTSDVKLARPRRQAQPNTQPKRQPPYAVILHNDTVNGFDFVVDTLNKVFGYATEKSFVLALQAHRSGKSFVWTGHRELAELKAEQIRSCGPDPAAVMLKRIVQHLCVTIEPIPGE